VYIGFLLLDKQWYSLHNDWTTYLPTFLFHLVLMMILVYTNALLLIPFLLQKKKFILYSLNILLLIAAYTFFKSGYQKFINHKLFHIKGDSISDYFWDSFVYAIWFTIVSFMLYITQKWYDHRQQVKNIQIEQLQTELKYLRAQINPHFLFNGLNTVYGSIDMNNEEARKVLLQFADLLRYNLYDADVDLIDLGKEALYLENYVALQKARSNSNLNIELSISIEDNNTKVAPLLFLPFVENAFKFSSKEDDPKNLIKINLQQRNNQIVFNCLNSYEKEDKEKTGIGLNNVRRRLELLYKDRYTLEIKDDNGIWNVHLTLNI
jgi:two-component system LytT family sensor kinase